MWNWIRHWRAVKRHSDRFHSINRNYYKNNNDKEDVNADVDILANELNVDSENDAIDEGEEWLACDLEKIGGNKRNYA